MWGYHLTVTPEGATSPNHRSVPTRPQRRYARPADFARSLYDLQVFLPELCVRYLLPMHLHHVVLGQIDRFLLVLRLDDKPAFIRYRLTVELVRFCHGVGHPHPSTRHERIESFREERASSDPGASSDRGRDVLGTDPPANDGRPTFDTPPLSTDEGFDEPE